LEKLSHPSLVQVRKIEVADSKLFVLMELCERSFRNLIDNARANALGPCDPFWVWFYMQRLADGLYYLHQRKVLHRDIKPDNILLINGEPKIADFGIARLVHPPGSPITIIGTPGYIAPELATTGTCDTRADLYSLGCCLFELATGGHAFKFPGNFDLIPDVTLKTVISEMLSANPDKRPPLLQIVDIADVERRKTYQEDCDQFLDDLSALHARIQAHEAEKKRIVEETERLKQKENTLFFRAKKN